jgi:hypothetical protein
MKRNVKIISALVATLAVLAARLLAYDSCSTDVSQRYHCVEPGSTVHARRTE